MTMTSVAVRQRPLRTLLLRFVQAELDKGESEIRTSELVARANERFQEDPEFVAAAVRDAIGELVPDVLSRELSRRRSEYVTTAAGAISRQRLEETVEERLGRVFESVSDTSGRKYKVFLDMNRGDLLASANDREQRATQSFNTEMRWVKFERTVASHMKDDDKPVRDALSPAVLADLMAKHFPRQDD